MSSNKPSAPKPPAAPQPPPTRVIKDNGGGKKTSK